LPSCGVTVRSVGVLLRFEPVLRGTDAIRWRWAEPFAPRGVVRTGVRRADRCGGRDDCFAPRAPKLKPKDAWTAEGLQSQPVPPSIARNSVPCTAHALLPMLAAVCDRLDQVEFLVLKQIHTYRRHSDGCIAIGGVVVVVVVVVASIL
jgi:hypothetical protein